MPPPRLLLTGFGPFPGAPRNPTASVVERVVARGRGGRFGCEILGHVLPTTWTALDGLDDLFAAARPDVVLHLGLKRRARAIAVERFARNRANPAAADAAGRGPRGTMLDAEGPPRLAATIPVGRVAARIAALRLPVEISQDAGRYLCNGIFWRSLRGAGGRPTGFLHLPPTREAAGPGGAAVLTLDDLVRATIAAIDVVAGRSPPPASPSGGPRQSAAGRS